MHVTMARGLKGMIPFEEYRAYNPATVVSPDGFVVWSHRVIRTLKFRVQLDPGERFSLVRCHTDGGSEHAPPVDKIVVKGPGMKITMYGQPWAPLHDAVEEIVVHVWCTPLHDGSVVRLELVE